MSIKSILNERVVIGAVVILIFFLGYRPISAYDSLYTAHVGKMILQAKTIPQTETISWTQEGKSWLIHQPLAQLVLGSIDTVGGPSLLSITAAISLSVFFLVLVSFFTRVCAWHWKPATVIGFFTAAAVAEFFIPRAQLFAQIYFIGAIFILYRKLTNPSASLITLIPLTYLWATSHASFIFVFYLILTSTAIAALRKQPIRDFIHVTLLALVTSVLPPIGLQGWHVLSRFSHDIQFLSAYITEWAPLSSDYVHFSFYIALLITTLVGCVLFWNIHKHKLPIVLSTPLFPIVLLGFVSLRHVPFGITAIAAICGLYMQSLGKKMRTLTLYILIALFVPLSFWLFANKYTVAVDSAWFFPQAGAQFLKAHKLQGRMFNEMALGSFLLYTVPEYKIFFDGRVEMFGDTQMREFHTLIQAKSASRDTFKQLWGDLDKKYAFSYALIPFQSYNPLEMTTTDRIADILLDDPTWMLIYVDDTLRIFIKNDGKNTDTMNTFSLSYITPKRNQLYKQGHEKEAYTQLLRMNDTTESAMAQTTLGQLDVAAGNTESAIARFKRAASLNPYWGLPLLEHAKLIDDYQGVAKEKLLRTALTRSAYLGDAYLELADLYIARSKTGEAKKILQFGLGANIDFIARRNIVSKLQQIP